MDNWAEHEALRRPVREEGRVYSATGGGKVPWVSKVDIAACAFGALTAAEAPGGDYIILGPELLSYGDVSPGLPSSLFFFSSSFFVFLFLGSPSLLRGLFLSPLEMRVVII